MKKYRATEESVEDYAKDYANKRASRDDVKQNPLEWNLVNAFKKGYRVAEDRIESIVRDNEILKDILSRLISEKELNEIKQTYYTSSECDRLMTEIQVKIAQLSHKKLKLEHKISKSHQTRNYLTELKKAERANKLNNDIS